MLLNVLVLTAVAMQLGGAVNVALEIGNAVVERTDASLVSFNLDWHRDSEEPPGWINASVQKIDFGAPLLLEAAHRLSPARLRIGGSEGDEVYYDTTGAGCPATTDPAFCWKMPRMAQLVEFCDKTNISLVFGLNGMDRADNNAPLNLTNIDAFLAYCAQAKWNIYAFELGNELEKVNATVMAHDYIRVRQLINTHWPSPATRPRLGGCDLNPNPGYYDTFLPIAHSSMDFMTFHLYVGYGLDPNLTSEILTSEFLDKTISEAQPTIDSWRTHAPELPLWVGETAAAWHSGGQNVTDRFVSSFWYADALASLARNCGLKGHQRQTLVGGYYGLLQKDSYAPNPDFYTGDLFHRLMGDAVLSVTVAARDTGARGGGVGVEPVRAYAHCTRDAREAQVTLLLINIDSTTSYSVSLPSLTSLRRAEYLLTASSVTAPLIQLNGALLTLTSDGHIPPLEPRFIDDASKPLQVPPRSILFAVLRDAHHFACE